MMCMSFFNRKPKETKLAVVEEKEEYLENNLFIVNVSTGMPHYSQLNNEYVHKNVMDKYDVSALTMCNVTSLCQSLSYNGWSFPEGSYEQPEDNLAEFALTNADVDAYYKKIQPAMYKDWKEGKEGSYPPNEIHAVLAKACNLWLGSEADTFKENARVEDIVNELIEGRSCVVSGRFPTKNSGHLNHIVSLVGAEWQFTSSVTKQEAVSKIKAEKTLPTSFIIDDTYGFWNTNLGYYEYNKKGDDVLMSYQDFIDIMKPVKNSFVKYCHFLKSGTKTV